VKQRIRVVAIIKNENGILILKRSRGRSEAPIFWELPTGKIKFGEQPEEAVARTINEYLGISATSIKIKDVITFLAPDGASRLSNLYIIYEVSIPADSKLSPRDRYTAYKFIKDFEGSGIRLNEATTSVLEIENSNIAIGHISPRDTANSVIINVDGASRGNPGPAGIGYCIYNSNGEILERGGEFIGFATSRVAEYYAMKNGIAKAVERGLKSARFVSDSLMVVNQLNGIFTPKNPDILPIYADIRKMLESFESVSFTHVPRSQNLVADAEANQAIDRILDR